MKRLRTRIWVTISYGKKFYMPQYCKFCSTWSNLIMRKTISLDSAKIRIDKFLMEDEEDKKAYAIEYP